jgi:hypothetical protein
MWIVGTHTHYGTYGRLLEVNEDGDEVAVKVEQVKRGRGRPKSAVNVSQMRYDPLWDDVIRKWVKGNRDNQSV